MSTVAEWREDLAQELENRGKVVYMVTVPRLYGTDDTPETFFYNTHYFTFQVIMPDSAEEEVRFKIFAGFARHYRMIDYLQEWDLNADIPATHRLKMNRTTYAVDSFSKETLESDFFPRLETMMNEINTFVWTRLANDIHADLFFADKFKDMINLQLQGRKKPKQEEATRFTRTSLKFKSEMDTPAPPPPPKLVEIEKMTDGNNIVLAVQNDTVPEPEPVPSILTPDQVPPEGFHVPLHKPAVGAYYLTIRKYHYTEEACAANADYVKRACYGPNPKNYKPALPFKMAVEQYGNYRERESLPVMKSDTSE